MVHKNWDKKFLAFLHRFNSLASEKERGSKVKNIFFHCTLFSLSFFFSFFKVSSILVIFSSTLEKSGWREKVFISSVLERRLIFRVLVQIIALWIFLDFSVPRTFFPSFSFSLSLVSHQSVWQERNCTSRCFCLLEIPLFQRSVRISRGRRFADGRNSSERRRIFVNVSLLSPDYRTIIWDFLFFNIKHWFH